MRASAGIRPTNDVDAIVDVASYAEYTIFSERLRALGLAEDNSDGAPLCPWRHGHLIVDVMPTDARVLAFNNRSYPMAIDTAQHLDIAGYGVRIVAPPLFIASKRSMEAGTTTSSQVTISKTSSPLSMGDRISLRRCPVFFYRMPRARLVGTSSGWKQSRASRF